MYSDFKRKSVVTKKQENVIHIRRNQMWDGPDIGLAGRDFKATIINMSKILMGKMLEEVKENMIWMSKQTGNVNREKKIVKKN